MTRVIVVSGLVLALAASSRADEVLLRNGGRFVGEVLERRADAVVLEADGGQITLTPGEILRIIPGPTPLSRYRERAAALAPGDLQGWLALARWARDEELPEPARQSFERVLILDPDNGTANQAMGRVRLGNRWMTINESYRARGYVRFEGRWMRPDERAAMVQERQVQAQLELAAQARAAAEAAAREAEARAREAEARAQEATARARAAEAEAVQRWAQAEEQERRRRRRWEGACRAPHRACIVHGRSQQPCCGLSHPQGRCPRGIRCPGHN